MSLSLSNDNFSTGNFLINSFSTPFWSDRDANGGGILLYVREEIPANLLATENAPFELNLRNTKWLLNCSYNPHKNMIEQHLAVLGKYLDLNSYRYI